MIIDHKVYLKTRKSSGITNEIKRNIEKEMERYSSQMKNSLQLTYSLFEYIFGIFSVAVSARRPQ